MLTGSRFAVDEQGAEYVQIIDEGRRTWIDMEMSVDDPARLKTLRII
jgi:hypothetical protein